MTDTISLVNSDILTIIRKHLVVKDTEKKLYGEVFTPVELVCEMLDMLPKEVWKNPNLKWLDPANGIGNYPIVVYYKLMDSLCDIPVSKRSKHIIEEMLYMVELNPINVGVCKKIFNMIDKEATPNIYNKDFLVWSENTDKKFDVIMGNPPYQDINESGNSKHGSGKLYPDFIGNSIKLGKKNSILTFITPNGWFSGSTSKTGKIYGLFKRYNLKKIKTKKGMTNEPLSNYFKGVGTGNLVYFQLELNDNYIETECVDTEPFSFKIHDFNFLPNIFNNENIKLFEKIIFAKNEKFEFIKDSNPFHIKILGEKKQTTRSDNKSVVKEINKTKEHKWKIYHSNDQILYSKYKNAFQDYNKILISNSATFFPYFDDGKLGFTQNVSCILVKNKQEGDEILKILQSKFYNYLIKLIRYSSAITINYLNYFPYPKNLKDQDIYEYYGIKKIE